ncbi:MAG: RNA 2',3'-cyclic phosphodiesterase [Promethearchaeota archaeon]
MHTNSKSKKKIRAFFALEIKNKKVIYNIKRMQEKLDEISGSVRIKMVEPANIHLTIRFLGNIGEDIAEKLYYFIETNINSVFFNDGPLEFDVINLKDFRKSVFFVDLRGPTQILAKINDILEDELVKNYHFRRETRQFRTHITIGRKKKQRNKKQDNREIKERIDKELYSKLKQEYSQKTLGRIEFEKLFLKKSTLTPNGPIYENLEYFNNSKNKNQ